MASDWANTIVREHTAAKMRSRVTEIAKAGKHRMMPTTQRYVALALAVLAQLMWAGMASATECQFFNAETNESISGKCTVDYKDDATEISLGEKTLVFKQSARQGQWAVGTLDGKPAVRYEINRVTYSYSTLDLTLFLDQAD